MLMTVDLEVKATRVLEEHIEEEFVHLLCCNSLDRRDRLRMSVEIVLVLFDLAPVLDRLLTQTGILLL